MGQAGVNPELFAKLIRGCWSPESATTYSADNPAKGQCSVTALLAQEKLGGELLKTSVGEAWHFYNRVEGERVDFTSGQFGGPIRYDDEPASREEAIRDTSPEQLSALRRALAERNA